MTSLKQIHQELGQLAERLAKHPSPGALEAAVGVLKAREGTHIASGVKGRLATRFEGLEPIGHGWWNPPQNWVIKQAADGFGIWTFTLLPYFPGRRAYREDLNGIVIRPVWRLAHFWQPAELVAAQTKEAGHDGYCLRTHPTVEETTQRELDWLTKQGADIPEDLRERLVAGSLDQARRRWGTDSRKVKERLIPLDGAMARDLDASITPSQNMSRRERSLSQVWDHLMDVDADGALSSLPPEIQRIEALSRKLTRSEEDQLIKWGRTIPGLDVL
jgi:hypothetical protein